MQAYLAIAYVGVFYPDLSPNNLILTEISNQISNYAYDRYLPNQL
jgi:hypothetical protein